MISTVERATSDKHGGSMEWRYQKRKGSATLSLSSQRASRLLGPPSRGAILPHSYSHPSHYRDKSSWGNRSRYSLRGSRPPHRHDRDQKTKLLVNELVGEVTEGNLCQNPTSSETMVSEESLKRVGQRGGTNG